VGLRRQPPAALQLAHAFSLAARHARLRVCCRWPPGSVALAAKNLAEGAGLDAGDARVDAADGSANLGRPVQVGRQHLQGWRLLGLRRQELVPLSDEAFSGSLAAPSHSAVLTVPIENWIFGAGGRSLKQAP